MPRFQVHPVQPTRRKQYHNGRLTKAPSQTKARMRTMPAVIDLAPAPPILDVSGTGAATAAAMATVMEANEPSTAPVAEVILARAADPVSTLAGVICPLCKKPIIFNDGVFNVKVIKLNGNGIQVHKVCPE